MQPRRIALNADECAAEPLAAVTGDRHLDFDEMAGVTLEIGTAHQRPVDARRGNLQPIGAIDRIGDIEHRRQRARHRFAILDLHRSVRPFRHDLHGAAGLAGNPDAHETIAQLLQDGAGDGRDARRHPGLDHQARLGQQFGVHGTSSRFGHIQRQTGSCLSWFASPERRKAVPVGSGNKKERVRRGPLSIRVSYETLSCGSYSAFPTSQQGQGAGFRGNSAGLNLTLPSPKCRLDCR